MTVHLPNTQIKTCFLILWFNCELKIETGSEKHKTKCPTNSRFLTELSKTKIPCIFFPKEGKELMLKTLEVYNVKTLEVYNVKTLEVYNVKNTRGV